MDAWTGARSEHLDHDGGGLGADDDHAARLREYYVDSWFDYRFLWLDPRTRAMPRPPREELSADEFSPRAGRVPVPEG